MLQPDLRQPKCSFAAPGRPHSACLRSLQTPRPKARVPTPGLLSRGCSKASGTEADRPLGRSTSTHRSPQSNHCKFDDNYTCNNNTCNNNHNSCNSCNRASPKKTRKKTPELCQGTVRLRTIVPSQGNTTHHAFSKASCQPKTAALGFKPSKKRKTPSVLRPERALWSPAAPACPNVLTSPPPWALPAAPPHLTRTKCRPT